MVTDAASSGQPAGPLGCGGALFVLVVVALLAAGFVALIAWGLRDVL